MNTLLRSVKWNAMLLEHFLKRLHAGIIVWGIVHCDLSNLFFNEICEIYQKKNIKCTLCVILIWSRMKRKAPARCSSVYQVGTQWKPMRSAWSSSCDWGPLPVSSITSCNQCAVTAMYYQRLGSDHMSMVKDIFPTEFCKQKFNQFSVNFLATYLHCSS